MFQEEDNEDIKIFYHEGHPMYIVGLYNGFFTGDLLNGSFLPPPKGYPRHKWRMACFKMIPSIMEYIKAQEQGFPCS